MEPLGRVCDFYGFASRVRTDIHTLVRTIRVKRARPYFRLGFYLLQLDPVDKDHVGIERSGIFGGDDMAFGVVPVLNGEEVFPISFPKTSFGLPIRNNDAALDNYFLVFVRPYCKGFTNL